MHRGLRAGPSSAGLGTQQRLRLISRNATSVTKSTLDLFSFFAGDRSAEIHIRDRCAITIFLALLSGRNTRM